jgi:hypothetical protein
VGLTEWGKGALADARSRRRTGAETHEEGGNAPWLTRVVRAWLSLAGQLMMRECTASAHRRLRGSRHATRLTRRPLM